MGAASTRHSLRPLRFRGLRSQSSDAIAPRECWWLSGSCLKFESVRLRVSSRPS